MPQIVVDPRSFLNSMRRHRRNVKWARLALRTLPIAVHEVTYESLIKETQNSLDAVFRFLDLPTEKIEENHEDLKKIVREPYHKFVRNIEELRIIAGRMGMADILENYIEIQ